MKPLGLQTVKFFGKTNEKLPKGYVMWWENIVSPNKKNIDNLEKKKLDSFLIIQEIIKKQKYIFKKE